MGLYLSVYIGPYVKAVPKEGSRSFRDEEFGEDLIVNDYNHGNDGDEEHWLPNAGEYRSPFSRPISELIEERKAGALSLDELDMDAECDAFEACYIGTIQNLKKDREVEICYGVVVDYS